MRLKTLALLTLLTASPVWADDVLKQAEALLAQHKAAEAVALLAPLEEVRAGNPDYDYLLGQALIESGDASQAVFAFERCLSVQPANGPCRVQMARTHLALGETVNARAELETIQAYNPPPQVQALVNQFLGAVSTREKQEKRQFTAYLQGGAGFDSNANNAASDTAAALSALPTFFGVAASGLPAPADSSFISATAGGSFAYRNTPKLTSFGDLGVNLRNYLDESNLSYHALDANIGAGYRLATGQISGKLTAQKMWLDGDDYRDVTAVSGQYQRDLGMTGQLAFFMQLNQLRYDAMTNRDSDRLTGGLAWSQAFEGAYSPVVYASLYTGNDSTTSNAASATQFSNDFTGVRAGGTLNVSSQLRINGSLSYETRQYDTRQLLVVGNPVRDDQQVDIGFGLAWKLKPGLTLQPGYTFTQNSSNTALYDYDRHLVSIDLRYDM